MEALVIACGGVIGALGRYGIGIIWPTPANGFPLSTLFINLLGSFVIGFIAEESRLHDVDPRVVLFVKVGLCGSFTTFSTFSLETFRLAEGGRYGLATCYALVSIIACLVGVGAGVAVARIIKTSTGLN